VRQCQELVEEDIFTAEVQTSVVGVTLDA